MSGGGGGGQTSLSENVLDCVQNVLMGTKYGAGGGYNPGSLTYSIDDDRSMPVVANTALTGTSNPFWGKSAYDPSSALSAIDTAVSVYLNLDLQDELSTWGDNVLAEWKDIADTVESELDSITDSWKTSIDSFLSDRLSNIITPRLEKGKDDVLAALSDLLSSLETDISDFDELLSTRFEKIGKLKSSTVRASSSAALARSLISGTSFNISYDHDAATMDIESEKIRARAEQEETQENQRIDQLEFNWPYMVFRYIANFIASASGGISQVERPSRKASVLGNVISGIGVGAMLGKELGSTKAGAFLGGVAGLLGGN